MKLFEWMGSALNLKTIVEKVNAINKRTIWIQSSIVVLNQTIALHHEKISNLEKDIMAKLQEVLDAIESTGTKIIEKINVESAEIVAALEAAKAGAATDADLDAIIARVNLLGSTIGDAVSALIPTVESPVEPTPAEEPVPAPVPSEPLPLPDVELPIEVSETEDGLFSIEPTK